MAYNKYDELGQLISKRVGSTDLTGNTPFQKVDYAYNVRGWLKAINDTGALAKPGEPTDLFAFGLGYDTVSAFNNYTGTPLFNGNISETHWTGGDGIKRSYSYGYDAMNRLRKAAYIKGASFAHSYDEDISYDRNGNIHWLKRMGHNDDTPSEIDEIDYVYDSQYKNRLMRATDQTLSPNGFKDGNTQGDDYAYDDSGNLTKDLNKGITQIIYNHLNLPTKILFGSEAWKIEYLYTADGRKVRKSAPYLNSSVDGGIGAMVMEYIGGFHYQDGILRFFPTAEGYVEATKAKIGSTYSYVFNHKDHLGNIRMSYAENPQVPGTLKILEENHYYPFGLKHAHYSSNLLFFREKDPKPELMLTASPLNPVPQFPYNYKYNGKEFQNEMGMDLYDYGARNYDPAIGRWITMDNLSELYFNNSSYVYALNTPVQAIDPDGNVVIFINGQHSGDGGKPQYWRQYERVLRFNSNLTGSISYRKEEVFAFDTAVMSHLQDNKPIYKDGAIGGFKNTLWETDSSKINLWSSNRINAGYEQGQKDASMIIANLAKDKTTGEIVETIKIITHSMGGAYGKGYVKALKEYIKTLPKEQQKQVKITLVADFDPFQAGRLSADPDIYTQQFTHLGGFWGLAEERQGGLSDENYYETDGEHSIFTFFSDISNLQEGTYLWNGNSWECVTCK
jgi:RHS repeat-associated protein